MSLMHAHARRLLSLLPCLVVGLVLAVGCGENSAELPQTDADLQNARDLADVPTTNGKCCILVPAGLTEYEVNKGGDFELGVLLYSTATGEPMSQELISWSMLDAPGDASLSAFETPTDSSGLSTVQFRAGEQVAQYRVQASFRDIEPVDFTVDVAQLPSGTFKVNVINSASSQLELTPFDIGLYYTSEISCRHFNPLNMPGGALATTQAQLDGDQVSFEDVLTGFEYTILGVAYGPNGNIAAKACIDKEMVFEDSEREVDLIFQLIPLNPVGTYRVRSLFDLGDALAQSGQVGELLVTILDGFDNPGELLYNVIIDLCGYIAPGFVCDGLDLVGGVTGLREDFQNFITDLVLSNETGCSIVRAGCDIRSAIRTLETLSTVYLSKLGADFRIYGTTSFSGLAFYWRQDCPVGSSPDCGRTELSYDELINLGVVSGDWEGTVTGYDKLVISPHGVDLNYGELIVFIVNQVILPAIADGATSFKEAFEYWFNCDGFANWLSGIEILGQSLSYNSAYSVCSGAISLLEGIVGIGTIFVQLQNLGSVMTLSGEVTFVELDGDFFVDELHDGTWGGTINIGDTTSPVTGVWSGCRIESETGTCQYPPVDLSILTGGDMACKCDAMCNCAE